MKRNSAMKLSTKSSTKLSTKLKKNECECNTNYIGPISLFVFAIILALLVYLFVTILNNLKDETFANEKYEDFDVYNLEALLNEDDKKDMKKYINNFELDKSETIFISIASYRDPECSKTIKSIFEKAKYPENIYVGICEQNDASNTLEQCELIRKIPKGHVRYDNIDYTEAKGPTYARYKCAMLYNGEKYFMQIDSHTFFVKDWDVYLLKMYKDAEKKADKPIITGYPASVEQMKLRGYITMNKYKLNERSKIPMFYSAFNYPDISEPVKQKHFIAAGFLFSSGNFIRDVKFHDDLPHLFQGEEVLMSVYSFMAGYTVFAPNIKICCHHYARKDSKYWTDEFGEKTKLRELSEKKVRELLCIEPKCSKYNQYWSDNEIVEYQNN